MNRDYALELTEIDCKSRVRKLVAALFEISEAIAFLLEDGQFPRQVLVASWSLFPGRLLLAGVPFSSPDLS